MLKYSITSWFHQNNMKKYKYLHTSQLFTWDYQNVQIRPQKYPPIYKNYLPSLIVKIIELVSFLHSISYVAWFSFFDIFIDRIEGMILKKSIKKIEMSITGKFHTQDLHKQTKGKWRKGKRWGYFVVVVAVVVKVDRVLLSSFTWSCSTIIERLCDSPREITSFQQYCH